MTTETPTLPQDRGTRKKTNPATGARILAAGASVAAGVGLVGAMATVSAVKEAPAATQQTVERIVVIQQPRIAAVGSGSETSSPSIDAEQANTLPTAIVVDTSSAPEPMTVSEGS